MKIIYNEIEKSIEIKDGLKTHYFALKILLLLNLLNAVLNIYDINTTGIGFLEITWMILGVISLILLYIIIIKNTALEKIPIEAIEKLKEKSIFGRKRISFLLKNGKRRNLVEVKATSELLNLKKMCNEIGIKTVID